MKDYFITNDKKTAQKELKKLFNKVIISDVLVEKNGYRIEWVSQKQFYKDSVESQIEMPKYLDFMLQKLEPEETRQEIKTDEVEEEEQKSSIFDALSKKVGNKKTPKK